MNDFQWKKKALLTEQLKFFGAKKLTFISEYAKKPKITCRAFGLLPYNNASTRENANWARAQLAALYQDQRNRGMQNSSCGYERMAVTAMLASGMGQAQFGGGLGGIAGLGSQLIGGRFI